MVPASSEQPVHSSTECVVYDQATGKIRHVHRVVTYAGGRAPSQDEIEADALRLANQLRPHQGDLQVLHLAAESIDPSRKFRVDPAKKVLITES
jgi:hypothetical protein